MSAVRLDKWMKDNDWPAPKLALMLKVSRATIYGWLKGDFAPSSDNLRRLAALSDDAIQISSFPPYPRLTKVDKVEEAQ